jgi:hypothetical protein
MGRSVMESSLMIPSGLGVRNETKSGRANIFPFQGSCGLSIDEFLPLALLPSMCGRYTFNQAERLAA